MTTNSHLTLIASFFLLSTAHAEKVITISDTAHASNLYFVLKNEGIPVTFGGRNGYVMSVDSIACQSAETSLACQTRVDDQMFWIHQPQALLDALSEGGVTVRDTDPKCKVNGLVCQLMPGRSQCFLTDGLAD